MDHNTFWIFLWAVLFAGVNGIAFIIAGAIVRVHRLYVEHGYHRVRHDHNPTYSYEWIKPAETVH